MKKWIPAFCLLMLALSPHRLKGQEVPLTAEERAWIQDNPEVSVSLLSSWAPFEYLDQGKDPAGYSRDYVKILCGKLGLQPRFIPGKTWQEYLTMVKTGRLDILSSVVKTPERSESLLFTPVYYTSRPGLAVIRENRVSGFTLQELASRRSPSSPLSFPEGFYYQEYFDTHYPSLAYRTTPSTTDALKKVLFDESYAALGDRPVLNHIISRHHLGRLKVVPLVDAPQFNTPLRLGIHQDNPRLAALLTKAAEAVTPREEALLKARWLEDQRPKDRPQLTLEEQFYLDSRGEFTMVTDPGWTPLAFIDSRGRHSGIANEYLEEISRKLGVPIRLIPTESWQESWEMVKNGEADIVSALMKTQEREKYCLFSDVYLEDPFVVAVREGAPFVSSIRDLRDRPVGVVENYATAQILREKYPGINLVDVPSINTGLDRVSSRELYAFIDSLSTISYQLGHHKRMDLKIAGQLDEKWEIAFGVNPREAPLVSILNKTLATIGKEERQNYWEKWIRINFDHTVNPRLIRSILLVAGIAAVLGLWRYLLVRKKNAQLKELNLQLEKLSITDPLTGLYNRLKMDRVLRDESSRAERSGRPYTLLILDIDHFKEVNDEFGHEAGDRVLVRIAGILRENIREVDIPARWGGEEILILCPETSTAAGEKLAERLRKALEEADHGLGRPVTASFGGAAWKPGEEPSKLLSRADTNLYRAKEAGRNQVCF